jgi:caffeoyl-CoA O-methyltransferase
MIVNPDIENYLMDLAPIPHPSLKEMEEYGRSRNFPIVGPLVGRFLYLMVEFGHVHTILECGSGFGYAAAWMALALPENGNITCIEYDSSNIKKAKEFFEKLEILHKVKFIQGNAVDSIQKVGHSLDMIFNDIDKSQYVTILPHLVERLRLGGILITDNVLWKGMVAEKNPDETTEHIMKFNTALFDYKSLWTSIVPIRDGLSVSVKLKT